jgi:hypothetical protein
VAPAIAGGWGLRCDGPGPGAAFAARRIRQQTGFCVVPLDRTLRQSSIEAWASIVARWKTSAACRPNASFAALVRLSPTSIPDEMREEHRRRVLGE